MGATSGLALNNIGPRNALVFSKSTSILEVGTPLSSSRTPCTQLTPSSAYERAKNTSIETEKCFLLTR
jgi:hypothetical protein